MGTAIISPARADALKRQAKRIKRSENISQSEALNRLALEEGFANWSLLSQAIKEPNLAMQKGGIAVAAIPAVKPHSVILSGFIRNREDKDPPRIFHEYLDTRYPGSRYAKCNLVPRGWCSSGRESAVMEEMATAIRAIQFMDATGLRPSNAHARVYGRALTVGFDHTQIWLDAENNYIITTEPYFSDAKYEEAKAWCKENRWSCAPVQRDIGIWNPCREGCDSGCASHTGMLVVAPPKRGGDASAVRDMLTKEWAQAWPVSLPRRT